MANVDRSGISYTFRTAGQRDRGRGHYISTICGSGISINATGPVKPNQRDGECVWGDGVLGRCHVSCGICNFCSKQFYMAALGRLKLIVDTTRSFDSATQQPSDRTTVRPYDRLTFFVISIYKYIYIHINIYKCTYIQA